MTPVFVSHKAKAALDLKNLRHPRGYEVAPCSIMPN